MDRFQDLLPAMMRSLTEALNGGMEATAQEALELLIELAGSEPRFLRRQLVEVVGSMLLIAEAESLEEGTRHLAIEFVITLAEARERAPGMMRKLPQFISRLFGILMKMLLDIEDEAAWHTAEDEDEDAGESSNYSVAQECLDRFAIALGGNTIVPVASEQLPAYLADPEWQKHHAALIALAQIAEGCSKVMIKNLEQVVTMVLNSFQDPHPRARWAAINAIGQLVTDLGPDLQVQFHQRVLPALAGAMDDFNNPRVQLRNAPGVLRQDHAVLVRWFSHSNGSVTSRGNVAHHASGDNTCLCKSCIGSASSTSMFTRSYRAVNTTKGQNGLAAKADQTSVSGILLEVLQG